MTTALDLRALSAAQRNQVRGILGRDPRTVLEDNPDKVRLALLAVVAGDPGFQERANDARRAAKLVRERRAIERRKPERLPAWDAERGAAHAAALKHLTAIGATERDIQDNDT